MSDGPPPLPAESCASEPPRRRFLKQTGAVSLAALLAELGAPESAQACSTPITGEGWPSVNGWEHRTIMHTTAGAFAACALDVIYDPYYGVAGTNSNTLAAGLDWIMRINFFDTYFYKGTQSEQLRAIDQGLSLSGGFQDAINLTLAAVLGAAKNTALTQLLGWPGPNGGYWSGSRHPLSRWTQPARLTTDGNLP
jgi:hypothetical protein